MPRSYLITDLGDAALACLGLHVTARFHSVRQLADPLPSRERERPADGGGAHGHLD